MIVLLLMIVMVLMMIMMWEFWKVISADIVESEYQPIARYILCSKDVREAATNYYGIDTENVKTIMLRLFFGSLRPDAEWEARNAQDVLPFFLELRCAVYKARGILEENHPLYP